MTRENFKKAGLLIAIMDSISNEMERIQSMYTSLPRNDSEWVVVSVDRTELGPCTVEARGEDVGRLLNARLAELQSELDQLNQKFAGL